MTPRHEFDRFTTREVKGYHDEPARKTPIVDQVDVLVVGGSQSGVCAAIAAARHGMRVLLVERFGFLGGQSIFGNVVQWEKRAFINNLGAVLTRGIPKEILDAVVAKGGSDGLWNDPPGCEEMRDGEEWLNPEALKVTLYEMCRKEGVNILLHCLAVDTIVAREPGKRPVVRGAIFESKMGRFAITAKRVVDATADLDLVWKAAGEDGCSIRDVHARVRAGFYTWYAGIDNEEFMNWYLDTYKGDGGYPNPKTRETKVRKHLSEGKLIIVPPDAFYPILEEADDRGLLERLERLLMDNQAGLGFRLGMKWVGNDRWCIAFLPLTCNLGDAWDVTRVEIFRQEFSFHVLPVLRMIPGWQDAYISRENVHIGAREFRTLKAMKIIGQDHVWDPRHATEPTPPDCVGRSGGHDPGKNFLRAGYPIPYGILVPEKLDGIIVCGRSVGTRHDRALDAHRGITPCAVTGQAAGTAAALSIKDDVAFRDLDTRKLQHVLREDGAQVDHESMEFDFPIPEDKIKKVPR